MSPRDPATWLEGWTPIAFRADDETLEWADLRGYRFDRPFFSHILERWRADGPGPVTRTDLSALAAMDALPSVDPDLIIAHPSRCGSTLLAKLAAAEDEGSILNSEPEILSSLMAHHLKAGFAAPVEQIVRQVVRAQGRIRFGDEGRHVLKLPSNMTRYLPVFRRAFPRAVTVWLQRAPAEILESNLYNAAQPLIPLAPEARVAWLARRVTLAFMAASVFVDEGVHVLDYRDLARDPLSTLAGLTGLSPGAADLARMDAVSGGHGHDGRPYRPRVSHPLPAGLAALARETLDPLYRAIGARARNQTTRPSLGLRQ